MNYIILGLAGLGALTLCGIIWCIIDEIIQDIKHKKREKEKVITALREDLNGLVNDHNNMNSKLIGEIAKLKLTINDIYKELDNKVDKTEDDITLEEVEKMCVEVDKRVADRLKGI